MDKAAKSKFEKQTLRYIESKKIYDVLENLMRKLALHQPEKPLDFLIDTLTHKKPTFFISVIGVETDVHKTCENISLQLNLHHICLGSLVDREIKNNLKFAKELKELKAKRMKIPDHILFPILQQELKAVDKFMNGILLEDFPTSLNAADFLKENKVLLSRIFAVSEETIPEKIAMKKVTHELLDIKDVIEEYEDFIINIDSKGKTSEKTTEDIMTMLNYRVKHSIPLRPPRILVLNPLGISFEKTAVQIAKVYGMIHIDAGLLLSREVDQKSRIGAIISDCFKNNDLVPDDLLCGLVYNEITKSNAKVLGWILTSFPVNPAQFHKYLSWEQHPHFVLNIGIKEESFKKDILDKVNISSLNYNDQVLVGKSRKNKEFLNEYLKNAQKLKETVEEKYPGKVESFDSDVNASQINVKVSKLLQNPVYYD